LKTQTTRPNETDTVPYRYCTYYNKWYKQFYVNCQVYKMCTDGNISFYTRLRYCEKRLLASSFPSVCIQKLGSNWKDFMKSDVIWWGYEKKIQTLLKSNKNYRHWTCRPDCTFMMIFSLIVFGPRNISGKSCIEIKTNFIPSKFYPQILAFMGWWRKVTVEADRPQMTI